jgi:hypothetical protein
MRFLTVVIAALVLMLAAAGAFAAIQVAEDARGEAAQTTVTRNDTLAVNSGITQTLVSDTDHDPTRYGANGTERVEWNGTVRQQEGNYTYYQGSGEVEFLKDRNAQANITYQYDIPSDQVADNQLQTATTGVSRVALLATGLSLVVLLLFIGGFAARRFGVWGGRSTTGR